MMEFGRFLRKCYRVNHTQTCLVIQYSSVGIARGNVEEGLRLRDKMMLKGLKFNGISYRALISSLCRNGQINEALSLLSELSDGDVEPDLFLYSMINIIHGLCKLGEVEKAVQLYKAIFPKRIYIKVGDLAEAIRLYENLLKKGSDPTIVTFNTLINGLCKAGKLDLARKWLDDMKMLNVVPAIVTYTTIMNAFCEVGNLKATYGNDNKWFGTKSHNLHSTYERACLRKARDFERAFLLYDEMVQRNIQPSNATHDILINGLYIYGDPIVPERVFCFLQGHNNKLLKNAFTTLIKANCAKGDVEKAVVLFHQMCAKDLC
ncbi:hypothetical protein OROMI_013614 [Orobanche minor]